MATKCRFINSFIEAKVAIRIQLLARLIALAGSLSAPDILSISVQLLVSHDYIAAVRRAKQTDRQAESGRVRQIQRREKRERERELSERAREGETETEGEKTESVSVGRDSKLTE